MPQRKDAEPFLSRWSRRKLEAAKTHAEASSALPVPPVTSAIAPAPVAESAAPAQSAAPAEGEPLPPVESLTFDSDFRVFMKPGVDPDVQRAALRKLLRDPRFNVMDGLDVYIDDYTKPSPLAPAVARGLAHARYLFSPPATRVNAEGIVEDVPEAAAPADAVAAVPSAIAPEEARRLPTPEPMTDAIEAAPAGPVKPQPKG